MFLMRDTLAGNDFRPTEETHPADDNEHLQALANSRMAQQTSAAFAGALVAKHQQGGVGGATAAAALAELDVSVQQSDATIPQPPAPPLGVPEQPVSALEWIRENSQTWNFVPECLEEAFGEAVERLTAVLGGQAEACDQVTQLYEYIALAATTAKNAEAARQKAEGIRKRIKRAVEAIKITNESHALLTKNFRDLQQMHNDMMRNMLCHLNREGTYAPDRPGASLIASPFRFK